MRTFNSNITAELLKSELSFYWLLTLGFSTTLYRTNCDIPIASGGNRFEPDTPYTVDVISAGSNMTPGTLGVTIANVDVVMAAIVLNEDIIGSTVALGFACLNAKHVLIDSEDIFYGFIDSWSMAEDILKLEVVNELALWNKRTLRKHSADCPWPFKGTECGYAGDSTWCDQSYVRCNALANGSNYGGFRFLSAIQEKEIIWGKL